MYSVYPPFMIYNFNQNYNNSVNDTGLNLTTCHDLTPLEVHSIINLFTMHKHLEMAQKKIVKMG
jgi:hypothetical protein